MFELVPRRYNVIRRQNPYNAFNLMESFFNDEIFNSKREMSYGFATDVKEEKDNYFLEADLPGFNKEDIIIETKNDILTIKAIKDEKVEEEKDGYIRRERRSGQLKRSFNLEGINQEDIKASYDNGVLKVILPKLEVKLDESRQIAIS